MSEAPASKRPPRQSRTGTTSTGARKAGSKSARSRAREFALQALYQHLVGGNDASSIDLFTRDLSGFHKADAAHYDALLHGCITTAQFMDELITPQLDRKLAEKRIYPAIDLAASGTRKEERLLPPDMLERINMIRRTLVGSRRSDESMEALVKQLGRTKSNEEFLDTIGKAIGK